ncbi:MAG: ATP-binding cassette domain-containing protein [Gammaproteobacteria bacterium]|nr:ATP-binding cassette domain-containing protein [Gammaproteobacteria bacterium]
MIEVEHLTKDYGPHRALDDISFSVEKGEILGFLGPNGAGKTTMMRILTCFFPPTMGRAVVAGYDCFEDSLNVRKRIGYLPERVPLYEDMKVYDYLAFSAGIKGIPSKDVRQKVAQVTDDFGLNEYSNRAISALSRGYRQRVGLAQAVVNDPDVLILDEPTVGLDPKQIKEIRKIIRELAGKRTVILSTHILPEVSLLCGRVIIINQGKLVAVDRPENLASAKSSKMFLRIKGNLGEIEQELTRLHDIKGVESEPVVAGDSGGFIIEFDKEERARKSIHTLIAQKGWELMEMRPMETSLEDVFIKLVTKEDA